MSDQRVIQEWCEATEDAIEALTVWLSTLRGWQQQRPNTATFSDALRRLIDGEALEMWADGCPAGGGLDRLAEAVTGGPG